MFLLFTEAKDPYCSDLKSRSRSPPAVHMQDRAWPPAVWSWPLLRWSGL